MTTNCLEPNCPNPVFILTTNGNGLGYCHMHREKGYRFNRGMA